MAKKFTAIRIKKADGTYSEAIPIKVALKDVANLSQALDEINQRISAISIPTPDPLKDNGKTLIANQGKWNIESSYTQVSNEAGGLTAIFKVL